MGLLRIASSCAFASIAAIVACSACNDGGNGGGGDAASLVVGVQADDFGSAVQTVHIVATMDGAVVSDQTVPPSALPKEVDVDGNAGQHVEVVVDGLAGTEIVVEKRGSTELVVANPKKLLRLDLDTRCISNVPVGSTQTPAPTCGTGQTCAAGVCVAEEIAPAQLEDYETDWAANPPDICRPANHGAPEVELGTGQTDYLPLTDGEVVQMERGPQGGHHIWIATRMKNLRQSGSRTLITGTMPDAPTVQILPAAYVFTYDPDEGNYCKLWGLRFQLDADQDLDAFYMQFLGKSLTVTTTVTDSTNASASSTKTIQIAPLLLCPDGTMSATCD